MGIRDVKMGINRKLTPVHITHASSWLSGSPECRLTDYHSSWIPHPRDLPSKFPKLDIGLLTDCLRDAASHVSRPPSPSSSKHAIHPIYQCQLRRRCPLARPSNTSSRPLPSRNCHHQTGNPADQRFIFFAFLQVENTRIVIRHAYQCCPGPLVLMTQVSVFDVWRIRRNKSPDLRCEQE